MTTMIYNRNIGTRNYTIVKGETFYDSFTFYDTGGAAVNLTGWKARFSLWPTGSPEGTTPTIALTQTAGITLGGVLGTIVITATPTQTRTLAVGVYDHQFELEDAAGAVRTYYIGTSDVMAEIATS